MARFGEALGFSAMTPLGSSRLGDHSGMQQAIPLETRLNESGRKQANVNCSTAQKLQATSTVLWEVSARILACNCCNYLLIKMVIKL